MPIISPSKEEILKLKTSYNNSSFLEAEDLALSLTKKYPNFLLGLKILGSIYANTGRVSKTIDICNALLNLNSNDIETLFLLGVMLQKIGNFEKSKNCLLNIIQLDKNNTDAHFQLGLTLQLEGKLDSSKKYYKKLLLLKPDHSNALNNLGLIHLAENNLEEAILKFQTALSYHPTFADAYNNLGVVYKKLNNLIDAKDNFIHAIKFNEKFHEAYNNLGVVLQNLNELKESEKYLIKSININNNYADAHNNLGITLKDLGKTEEAEKGFRKAIEINPLFADAYLNLCDLLEKSNKLDELLMIVNLARKSNLVNQYNFLYFESLAYFRKGKYDRVDKILMNIDVKKLNDRIVVSYFKLKGDLYNTKGEFNKAFKAYHQMNSRIKISGEFNENVFNNFYNHHLEKLEDITNAQLHSIYINKTVPEGLQPTFLIGFPRSGTTLLDTILRSHSKINVVEEKPMITKVIDKIGAENSLQNIEKIDKTKAKELCKIYFEELNHHISLLKQELVIDKLPLNILQIPLINQMFPKSKFILAIRNPYDCILSCWMQNFKLNPAMGNMVDLDRLVNFYCNTMKFYNLCQKRYSINSYTLRYEDLINNFDFEVKKILNFLNLQWEDSIADYQQTSIKRGKINTPSYWQVIKPIYKNSLNRWKNYEFELNKYANNLKPFLEQYKYL